MTEGANEADHVCRVCKVPLVPPDRHKKYRTIRCGKCKEVTPVGPPAEGKKYVLCTCNALLIVPDDSTIFTCTRCGKLRTATEMPGTPRTLSQSNLGGLQRGASAASMRAPSMANLRGSSDGTKEGNGNIQLNSLRGGGGGGGSQFGIMRATSVGTLRNSLIRTVSSAYIDPNGQRAAVAREASSAQITPVSSFGSNYGAPDVEGAIDIEKAEEKLNHDQKFIVDFFAARVRPSVVGYIDGDKFWFMRLKILIFLIYNIIVSVMILTNFLEHWFWKQFGFRKYEDWAAVLIFGPYIACFSIEWICNKLLLWGYLLILAYYGVWAAIDERKRAFFWNIYDCAHCLEEIMLRVFYMRIPRLQVPLYRFLNPPSDSQTETEFFFLSDVHLIELVFAHPRVSNFFKFWLGVGVFVKIWSKGALIAALILLDYNAYSIFYAAETFLATVWMIFSWAVTNQRS